MRLNPDKKLTVWIKCPLPGAEGAEYHLVFTPYEKAKRSIENNSLAFGDLLLDWRGVEDQDGNPIPCTPENRAQFLEDVEGQKHLAWMFVAANDITNFFDLESYLKNLPAPSSGASTIQKPPLAAA